MIKKMVILLWVMTGAYSYSQNNQNKHLSFSLYPQYEHFIQKQPVEIIRQFTFAVETKDSVVVLSFDDGPGLYTERVTNTLKKFDCPAAFFVITKNISEKNVSYYLDTLFTLSIHGYTHSNYTKLSYNEVEKEIKGSKDILLENGITPKYFRPPYGAFDCKTVKIMQENQLKGILWNIDSYDWNGYAGEELVDRVLKYTVPGSIILFHESIQTEDLKKIITGLRSMGYRIVSLDELLQYPACPPP